MDYIKLVTILLLGVGDVFPNIKLTGVPRSTNTTAIACFISNNPENGFAFIRIDDLKRLL